MARALKGFQDAEIAGTDTDADVREKARRSGTADAIYDDAAGAIKNAGLILFCVYPRHIPGILKDNAADFAPGAVISDICGVKSLLYENLAPLLPPRTDYVGIHPMAGKERDGFDNADPAIYKNAGMIICPLPATRPESVGLMKDLAAHIGAAPPAVSPCGRHDEIIAYTSDVMHKAATALCMDYHPDMTSAYTAGAYRDCTRIADINAEAWTELLLANAAHTQAALERYIGRLQEVRGALAGKDAQALRGLLETGGRNKREMLLR
jgi:prephenate dehydrogenase